MTIFTNKDLSKELEQTKAQLENYKRWYENAQASIKYQIIQQLKYQVEVTHLNVVLRRKNRQNKKLKDTLKELRDGKTQ